MDNPIRILLIDDHILFREGLSRLLQADSNFRVVGNCSSAKEALASLESKPADVVLLDYDLGDETGTLFLEEARRRGFQGRVILVTAGMSDADTLRALNGGASGVFLKHSAPAELTAAIHKVARGEMWIDSKAVRSLVVSSSAPAHEPGTDQLLNTRERAALKAVFEGLTNKEIALRLRTSETAVKWVMQQLFDKTGVRTRSQLVRMALERHWLSGES